MKTLEIYAISFLAVTPWEWKSEETIDYIRDLNYDDQAAFVIVKDGDKVLLKIPCWLIPNTLGIAGGHDPQAYCLQAPIPITPTLRVDCPAWGIFVPKVRKRTTKTVLLPIDSKEKA